MTFHIITIFPEIFKSYFSESIIKRAQDQKLIKIKIHDLRKWSNDKHKTVDDTPYGGGAGMILKIEPLYQALKELAPRPKKKRKIILFSASGKTWQQKLAKNYAEKYEEIIMICGRYEGVDARILNFIDQEISTGPYVLTGGEIPAMTIVDSISRLIPEVLGNQASLEEESFNDTLPAEYPQYTKPATFKVGSKSYPVPEVLLSGNHQKIKKWRQEEATKISKKT
ncbi:MAG: tRNA (guanosine(37)-N1)-methyltransferase TrmD [Candidatus Pacebacteria bacterium]|nr:tRNA (guanosine(37)-N1)-methyltransferase TrmD [Candidatus Paceibacterota bacterium]